jgi:hypothetical protein
VRRGGAGPRCACAPQRPRPGKMIGSNPLVAAARAERTAAFHTGPASAPLIGHRCCRGLLLAGPSYFCVKRASQLFRRAPARLPDDRKVPPTRTQAQRRGRCVCLSGCFALHAGCWMLDASCTTPAVTNLTTLWPPPLRVCRGSVCVSASVAAYRPLSRALPPRGPFATTALPRLTALMEAWPVRPRTRRLLEAPAMFQSIHTPPPRYTAQRRRRSCPC